MENPESTQPIEPETTNIKTIAELLPEKESRLLDVKEIIFADVLPNENVKRSTKPMSEAGKPDSVGAQIDRYNESKPIEIGDQEVIFAREEKGRPKIRW